MRANTVKAGMMEKKFYRYSLNKMAVAAVVFAVFLPANSWAQQKGQKTYLSPEEASKALVAAVDSNDQKAMLEVLGPDGKKIIASGDPKEDAENRANFCRRYQAMHRLVDEPDGTTTLYIGAENWPTPIALVKNSAGNWYFDTEAGMKEILFRRIGHNELSAIRVCQELAMAQKEYFAKEGSEYAQKFQSSEGKRDGLHWVAADKKDASPIGPMVAHAGGDIGDPKTAPFRGYYFRMLTGQGKDVTGGAMDYVVDGKMTKGFAFVAYPAVYRDSGVMTFLVDQDGVVYEKDLGKQTSSLAKSMKVYGADSTWRKSDIAEQLAEERQKK